MKIYMAARYSDHPWMRIYRNRLKQIGHTVTSRWINGDHEERFPNDPVAWANEDLDDLLRSDCSIHFTEDWQKPRPGRNRGGRHVEFGIALALHQFRPHGPHRIIVVGYRENVFHHLPKIEYHNSWAELFDALWQEQLENVKRLAEKGTGT